MKECPRGFYLVRKSTPRVPGDISRVAILYGYISQKVLGFDAVEGGRSNELGVPYFSCYPENYSIVSICPVLCHHFIGSNFSACNTIYNYNRMRQSDVALEKYWETQSVYFRIADTVALGMGIKDGRILLCHIISQQSKYNNISMRK